MAPWEMPEPLLPIAVVPKTRSDEDALARTWPARGRRPDLRLERNPRPTSSSCGAWARRTPTWSSTGLRGGGVELDTETVRVALRETFTRRQGHGRHVKQSGGHGQYAVCDIEVEPLPRGSGFEFVDKVVGGSVPHNYIPSVEKGVRAQMERGSSPATGGRPAGHALRRQGHTRRLLRRGVPDRGRARAQGRGREGADLALEPIDEVVITVPGAAVGSVMSDLSGRRGRVLGTESDPTNSERRMVRAEVPATELSVTWSTCAR
jgi:elongation factor G